MIKRSDASASSLPMIAVLALGRWSHVEADYEGPWSAQDTSANHDLWRVYRLRAVDDDEYHKLHSI